MAYVYDALMQSQTLYIFCASDREFPFFSPKSLTNEFAVNDMTSDEFIFCL